MIIIENIENNYFPVTQMFSLCQDFLSGKQETGIDSLLLKNDPSLPSSGEQSSGVLSLPSAD